MEARVIELGSGLNQEFTGRKSVSPNGAMLGLQRAETASGCDVIAEFVLAMKQGLGLKKILDTIHVYPTLAEANHSVAVTWLLEHAPQRVRAWRDRVCAWRRCA